MVVSDMNDRLSPNMAPLTTTPSIRASGIPVLSAIPTATGAKATIVPTDVPTEMDMKQAAKKIPAANRLPADGHRQIHGSVYGTHRLGGLREGPGEDEDQYHQHDIAVGRPPAELLDAVA